MVLLWGIIGVFSGCADGLLLDRMLRPNRDPEVDAPEVISFEKENLISVRWREDTAADSYILHRALDGVKLNWEQIYIGRALRYDDTEAASVLPYECSPGGESFRSLGRRNGRGGGYAPG